MRILLAYFWQRRWRFFLGAILALVGLPLLHPFVRQALFGPTINDIPLCVWEDAVRYRAHPERAEGSWLQQKLIKAGLVKAHTPLDADIHTRGAIPVLIHMADDADPEIRWVALRHLEWQKAADIAHALPVFRNHLQDSDPQCRLSAMRGTWRILFDPLSKLADEPDEEVQSAAVRAQRHIGKVGVPTLRKAMSDSRRWVRVLAIRAAAELGKDGAELYPELLAFQTDRNQDARRNASETLHKMDPVRFPTSVGD